ncbi:phenylalanine--tRNA ligase subunit beta [Butyricicoccus faecihominis]|uniref:phenylalanine--tRNA ligase subunit beta n=1 Tax=Butyricicoccus faecihominis TaxID=1712515 RepID=UPI0024792EA3|nr:phenylalanine--tRNA ligase subunit beta [Butyricicoccus faecihominis]MCQ5130578.1 phenylalanine--tRNA ligase subunit beta [Butyricicoccus faecihominis]
MKLPLSWLSDYTDISGVTPKEFDAKMTMSGSKVEEVVYLGEEIENVVTGKVLSVTDHPDSDHLKICQLDVGQGEPVQIVTGAPNVTEASVGEICPVALHKSALPGGVKITKGKLRGVPSNGMMCSFQELGLTHGCVPYACENGILFLPDGTPVGEDIRKVVGLDDYVADFEITSNRPDCLSVIGLAREAAATFDRPFSVKTPEVKGVGDDIGHYMSVEVRDPDLCPRYTARLVKNIKIEPSPAWIRERLHAAGVRPINNIVDITNYVMLEYGQPMHAFDYACLSDGKIVVRRAQNGESIQTLDGVDHDLTDKMLAICDHDKPVAVAGVMGGANSEIEDDTKTVVFESACFHGATVRVTAKALGMRTEASGRFEKGLDPRMTLSAVDRACELVEELHAGEVVNGVIDVDSSDPAPKRLPFEPDKMNALLGLAIPADEQKRLLEKLDFTVEGGEVVVPSFRTDILRMCDLAEEVARMYGYDQIPTTLYAGEMVQGEYTPKQQAEREVSLICREAGFDESMSHSFISPKFYDMIGWPENDPRRVSTTILNPLGEDFSIMRTTILPSMLDSLAHNHAHRNPSASLFELGTIYTPTVRDGKADQTILPREEKILALGSYGSRSFFQFKGVIEAIAHELNIKGLSFETESENPSYHPGRCARVMAGDQRLGVFGTVHPTVCKTYGLSGEVLAAELHMDVLFAVMDPTRLYHALPKFPASTRDIAVIVNDAVPAASLQKAIEQAAGSILESVSLFDVYKGENIPEGKKSLAYSMSLRAPDRTLTDEECDKAMRDAIAALEKDFGAKLRG